MSAVNFFGTYTPKLDDKGRLVVPAKLREAFNRGLVITRGQERCLYVFPAASFDALLERIRALPLTSKQAREFQRVFLAGAHDETPDKQHRVTIPGLLREYASLDKELTVIGVGDRVEIWDSQKWQEVLAASEEHYSDISEEVFPGIF